MLDYLACEDNVEFLVQPDIVQVFQITPDKVIETVSFQYFDTTLISIDAP